ncbi:hypothetical protein N9044_00140 [bacterium]|nr:hypothetical protein [Akkermansiaceae bacterium]MDB4484177.1 hypothetical protein [bacterium]
MNDVFLRPLLVLLLPFSLFFVLYFACRKENAAIDVNVRYRLALVASLTFLLWVVFSPYYGNRMARLRIDLLSSASVACAWGLAVTGSRLGVKKPVLAIALTVSTTLSLGFWGLVWVGEF